jgi:hypothetical protein
VIEIILKKPDVRLLLKVLDGPSVTDPKAAEIYEYLKRALEESEPRAPWRLVVRTAESGAYRGNGIAARLYLDCGHCIRESGIDAREIQRSLDAGAEIRRRCRECAGGPPRRAAP